MSVRDKLGSMVVYVLTVLAVGLLAPLIILVFAIAVLWHEPRIAIGIALALLAVTAITLATGFGGVGERFAVCAYAGLAVGVTLLLVRLVEDWLKKTSTQ